MAVANTEYEDVRILTREPDMARQGSRKHRKLNVKRYDMADSSAAHGRWESRTYLLIDVPVHVRLRRDVPLCTSQRNDLSHKEGTYITPLLAHSTNRSSLCAALCLRMCMCTAVWMCLHELTKDCKRALNVRCITAGKKRSLPVEPHAWG